MPILFATHHYVLAAEQGEQPSEQPSEQPCQIRSNPHKYYVLAAEQGEQGEQSILFTEYFLEI